METVNFPDPDEIETDLTDVLETMIDDPDLTFDQIYEELYDWLFPIYGKYTHEAMEKLEPFATSNRQATVNLYRCVSGHEVVTVDRDDHDHLHLIPCPICKQDARSHFYFIDQKTVPSHEFKKVADPNAYDKKKRGNFRRGAVTFKSILESEPIRFGTKLKLKPKSGNVLDEQKRLKKQQKQLKRATKSNK